MTNKKLYNVIETGKLLGIGKAKVYELIKHGYLPALDLGGLKISDAAIDSFISKYNGHSFKNIDAVTQLHLA
jgi:excisionase family DNA binding protein